MTRGHDLALGGLGKLWLSNVIGPALNGPVRRQVRPASGHPDSETLVLNIGKNFLSPRPGQGQSEWP